MLIRSLHAKDFRKYHRLEVDNIPQHGVITVSGLNESGKTSIGESICFALFGRTFFLDKKNLHKIIAWGQEKAEVTLKFSAGDVENPDKYTLYRSVDRDGETSVKLTQDNVSKSGELTTERTASEALSSILGFDYDAFANSFYLAQRELTTPEPQGDTIKKMAGIGDYAELHDTFLETNDDRKVKISQLGPQIITDQKSLDSLKLDESLLPEMVDAEQSLSDAKSQRNGLSSFLDENENTYANNVDGYFVQKKKRSLFRFLTVLMIPIVAISWALWVGKKFFSERLHTFLTGFLSSDSQSFIMSPTENWLLPVGILSVIAYILSSILMFKVKGKMSTLNAEASDIATKLSEGHSSLTTEVEGILPERITKSLVKRNQRKGALLTVPPSEQFSNLQQLIDDAPGYDAKHEEMSAAIARLSGSMKKQSEEIEIIEKVLVDDINKEKSRSDEAGELRANVKKLSVLSDTCQHEIEVNNISIGLLQRAAVNSIDLFNKNIEDISASTLPKFTEGRYSEVKIADDLSVQVYSDEKKDYMDFDEISSGTQRQIMLAVRMAMSEELATNSGNTEQFIFLDEPFAFFDHKRTVSTLKALPDVSKVISQVWVVAQDFPNEVAVNKSIVCPTESTELVV